MNVIRPGTTFIARLPGRAAIQAQIDRLTRRCGQLTLKDVSRFVARRCFYWALIRLLLLPMVAVAHAPSFI